MDKKRIYVIDIIKAIACIMIFLYHCNTFLPGEWRFLTYTGQDLGNNLFFMVSGFALMPSIAKTPLNKLPSWYLKRVIRVLPITAISYIICYLTGYYSFGDPSQLFAVFVYPTLYWFVTAILIYYLILFVMGRLFVKIDADKKRPPKSIIITTVMSLILFAAYIAEAGKQERLYIIGFLSMIIGYSLRQLLEDDRIKEKIFVLSPYLMAAGIMIFAIGKHTENTGGYGSVQALFTGAGVLLAGKMALIFGYRSVKKVPCHALVKYVGDMALPIYIVQCYKTGYIGYFIGLSAKFPASFIINFIVVWGLGTLLWLFGKGIGRLTSPLFK